jgi:hypothetical protein
MKFKSAEADWNTSFVSQHVEGRNPGRAVARKLYRLGGTGWVYWTGYRSRNPGSGEDVNEEIFEVCCQFLDECVPSDRVDGHGPDHAGPEGKEEEWQLNDQPCARGDLEHPQPDTEWNDHGPGDFVGHDIDHAGSDYTEWNDDYGAKDDRWPGQTHDPRAAVVI